MLFLRMEEKASVTSGVTFDLLNGSTTLWGDLRSGVTVNCPNSDRLKSHTLDPPPFFEFLNRPRTTLTPEILQVFRLIEDAHVKLKKVERVRVAYLLSTTPPLQLPPREFAVRRRGHSNSP
jgi:hypothetical protein